jgi:adenylate cyclase
VRQTAHGGREISTLGTDHGVVRSASKALECAIAMQQAMDERNRGLGTRHDAASPSDQAIRVRIGLNGRARGGGQNLFGTAVQVAARVCGQAEPGEILVSNVVRELAAGKDFLFADRGERALRGFEDPVRVWEVRWQGD